MSNPTEELRKALNLSGAAAVVPEIVSAGVQEYLEKSSLLYNLVPKKDWNTAFWKERSRTALGNTSAFVGDGGTLPNATQSTYAKPAIELKFAYARGEVTGPTIAFTRDVMDALREEIMASADELARKIETVTLNGDSGGNALEFDGFFKQVTNAVDASSAALSLNLMDQMLDKPEGGAPTHIVMSKAFGRKLWSILQAHQSYVTESVDVGGGFRVPTYADTPIIRMDTGLTSSGGLSTGILAIDTNHCFYAVGQGVTYEDLAHTKDSRDYMLKTYLALVVQGASRFHSKLTGLQAAGA